MSAVSVIQTVVFREGCQNKLTRPSKASSNASPTMKAPLTPNFPSFQTPVSFTFVSFRLI